MENQVKMHTGTLALIGADYKSSNGIPLWKRSLDITCVLFGLPLLLPLFIAIALAIKAVSPGPVLYRQERIGYRGRRFWCLKFRSMKIGAATEGHKDHTDFLMKSDVPMTKMDAVGDSRLIPFGRILRASGLDELPQLVNMLRGEMSIVGPRPCTPYECDGYLPWHRQRFDTMPGLTGLWQVSGKNKTTFTEMMNLDIHYAHNKSLLMDLNIMWRTFSVLLSQIQEAWNNGETEGLMGRNVQGSSLPIQCNPK